MHRLIADYWRDSIAFRIAAVLILEGLGAMLPEIIDAVAPMRTAGGVVVYLIALAAVAVLFAWLITPPLDEP